MTGIASLARKVVPAFIFRVVRPAARVLPYRAFRWLAWPAAATFALLELARLGTTFAEYDRMPAPLRGSRGRLSWAATLWRDRARIALAWMVGFWPEWLTTGRRGRIVALEGPEEWRGSLADRSRPTVLATLHFGPLRLLYLGLRTLGVPVAVLTWDREDQIPSYRRQLLEICDRASGTEGVPHFFAPGELWEVADFLRADGVLLVLMSGGGGRHLDVSDGGVTLSLSPGALKIASLVDAAVIPFLARMGPRGLMTISLGPPVPRADVGNPRRHKDVCEQFFRSALPILRSCPGQVDSWLLKRLRPGGDPAVHDADASKQAVG